MPPGRLQYGSRSRLTEALESKVTPKLTPIGDELKFFEKKMSPVLESNWLQLESNRNFSPYCLLIPRPGVNTNYKACTHFWIHGIQSTLKSFSTPDARNHLNWLQLRPIWLQGWWKHFFWSHLNLTSILVGITFYSEFWSQFWTIPILESLCIQFDSNLFRLHCKKFSW